MTDPDSKTSETSNGEVAPVESQALRESEVDAEAVAESGPEAANDLGADVANQAEAAAEADTVSGDVAAEEAQADTVAGDAAPEPDTPSSSGDLEAPGGKKKRRRRRKKKGASEAPEGAKSGHHHAPFEHLFSAGVTRKHAFSPGEEIAGRVERVEHGAIIIDVFGKASAIADVNEPRDIPVIVHAEPTKPEAEPTKPEVEAAPDAAAPDAQAPGAPDAPVTEADVVQSPVADAPPVEAALPEVARAVERDTSEWAFSSTDVTDIDELAEADTVVAAQAFDPATMVEVPQAPPLPNDEPAAASDADSSTVAEPVAQAAADPTALTEPPEESEKPEDADLSLLEPLPELDAPQVGAIFRGRISGVAESGHIVIVNRIIDKSAVRKALRAARELHQRVQGLVYGYNRGGFDVLVGGVRAFCPASAMSLKPIEDPNAFLGQRCEFSLPQDKGGKKSIIVSRRNILEKQARQKARERMAELEVGMRLQGKVIEIRDYGVLVDLGDGLDGLVHMSEVSWGRGVRPQDAATVGDEVEVEVLKVQPASRKDRFGRVSLSMRACQPDPLETAKDTIRPGTPIKGKVVRTTEFGAFIQLEENVEGLLHISELGGSRELTHAKQAVTEGDEIHVVVERVDRQQRRISLSKLSEADAAAIEAGEIEVGKAPGSLKPGSVVPVIVKRVDHSGVQVQVQGMLGKRGRGFIRSRELQDSNEDRKKGVSQGDVIEVKVIGTERDGSLRCSIRARLLDDERKAVREYRKESAKQGLGTFGDLLKAKLGGGSD
ncbi:MAG: S1 RNA-binding domain-containing protein [Deltaproteobacteria bacterium]|nr:MAG: S1 RNA-binding domain-containing protein [Deltaproteobacteria bacterium]